jgi:Tfp pilus assembly protein PilF
VTAEAGGSRAYMGLVLAHVLAGDRQRAEAALDKALEKNPHFGKAVLGFIRRHVDNVVGAAPGSREEAVVYAQTYGDVWNDDAKKFLEGALEARAQARARAAEDAGKATESPGGAAPG